MQFLEFLRELLLKLDTGYGELATKLFSLFGIEEEILWGTGFTPIHLTTLIIALLIPFALHFALRGARRRTQTVVLFIISLIGPFSLIYDIVLWGIPTSPLLYLPLHICSYNALLTPILVLTKNKFLGNLLPLFSVGAAFALLFNSIQAEYSLTTLVFLSYFLSHTIGTCLPFLMISLGHVRIQPRQILPCIGGTLAIYTASHFANVAIIEHLTAKGLTDYVQYINYMFSIYPQGNPMLEFFWSIIPHSYFYMLMVIPIVAVYFIAMNIPNFIRKRNIRSYGKNGYGSHFVVRDEDGK